MHEQVAFPQNVWKIATQSVSSMRMQSKGFGRCFASRIRSARPSRPATVRPVIASSKRINSSSTIQPFPPNAPIVHGKTAIRAGWAKLIGNPGFTIDWQISKLEVARSGDLAYTIYAHQMSLDGPNGKPITDQGKDMAVWKKHPDGAWKMVADTFNSDLAVKSQAKTPETKHKTIKHRPHKRRRSS